MLGDSTLDAAVEASQNYLADAESKPLLGEWSVDQVRAYLESELQIGPARESEVVVEMLARGLEQGTLHLQNPCYYGLFNPGVTPVSVAADLLVAAFNPQLAAWSHGGFASESERHVLDFFAGKLGMPAGTSSFFTSGGQEANQSALTCALAHRLDGFAEQGLTVRPTIYLSAEAHHSFHKAAKASGIGTNAVREVPVDASLALIPSALENMILEDKIAGFRPVMAVATVGTTGAGAIDPVSMIEKVCRRHDMWIHVDAAWAAAVCLSPRLRHLGKGMGEADSVTWDAHKWLQVPMGAGMFFCRHADAVKKAFGMGTSYMPASVPGAIDSYDTSPQWSRRAIGFKVLAQIATMGESGLANMIDSMTDIGDLIRKKTTDKGWTVVNKTPFPLVCVTHPEIENGFVSIDDVLAHVYRRSKAWVSIYRFSDGRRTLRACVTNRLTKEAHVDLLVEELEFALEEARK